MCAVWHFKRKKEKKKATLVRRTWPQYLLSAAWEKLPTYTAYGPQCHHNFILYKNSDQGSQLLVAMSGEQQLAIEV